MKSLLLFLSFGWSIISFGQKAEIAFRIPEKDLIPEGIAYDASTQSFFVSSINKRKIVRVDASSKISDFVSSGQDEIGEVLGLKVLNGKLWACNNSKGKSMVHQFDIASGKLLKKWIFETGAENHLFNDLAITKEGEAYVSDSDYGAVYHVSYQTEKPELWSKDDRLKYINGITLLTDGTLVVNASIGFFKINTGTKRISRLPFKSYYPLGIDGLSYYKQSMIGVQNVVYPVSINQYYLNDSLNQITRARVLASDHPMFDIPTTGTIAQGWFYFVATSQLENFDNGKIKDPSKLREVLIMRIKLD